jgi:hypothetical protein
LADRLTIEIDGKEQELFMSFGLLDEISRLMPDAENLGLVNLDPELRSQVLIAVLSQRDEAGKIEKEFSAVGSKLSIKTTGEVLDWVTENVLDFFVRALESARKLQDKHGARVRELTSSLPGSPA